LCKCTINVRTFGVAAKIVTGDLQDTDCTVMLVGTVHTVQYSTVQYITVQYNTDSAVQYSIV